MTIRFGDILAQHLSERLFGRDRELAVLMQLVEGEQPLLVHVFGIPGIGKSALMRRFGEQSRDAGAATITIDCHTVEPTETGFLSALGAAVGHHLGDAREAADAIGAMASRVVLVLDHFEAFGLMDSWLREIFVPLLPHNMRVALFSRQPPSPLWLAAPAWQRLLVTLRLDTLDGAASQALLHDAGVCTTDAGRIAAEGRGHPLALLMAARAWHEHSDRDLGHIGISRVNADLAALILADIADPTVRRAAEAAAVMRRVTEPLLASLFPDDDASRLYEELRSLPIVDHRHDGLVLHDAVRHAVTARLKSTDPDRSRSYRAALWQHLRANIGQAPICELWRNTADTIYLLENAVVRDAFFPPGPPSLTAVPAQPADGEAILQIVRNHDGNEASRHLEQWWLRQRSAFHVIKDAAGQVAGFYCLARSDQIDPFLLVEDPIAANWWRHICDDPIRRDERILFLRRWLSAEDGEHICAVQAACWLDIKRTYLELRPALRRVYLALRDMEPYGPIAARLGFAPLAATTVIDNSPYHSGMLDFGPQSVDGWILALLGAELGQDVTSPQQGVLDHAAREFVLGDQSIALTQKEFALLNYLHAHARRAVPRDELLDEVWGWKFDGGSNVVDVLVRALRRKLGNQSVVIETVRGIGYRYQDPAR